ncbi:MAG: AAA family ATPase, partial [Hyphomicrobiales bacterium]|nr:AAA family ATPase [Hyphomicrobiales bacterium]
MRHLIIMRGAPGAGKSTFIEEQGLRPFTVSPDEFRLRLGGIVMSPSGEMTVNHAHEKRVWAEVEDVLDFKMGQGQLVVIDATFQKPGDFTLPTRLAERHMYEVWCVDFSGASKELALERNRLREVYKVVPDHVIETAYERFARHPMPKNVTRIAVADLEGKRLLDRLEPKMRDLSSYREVMH